MTVKKEIWIKGAILSCLVFSLAAGLAFAKGNKVDRPKVEAPHAEVVKVAGVVPEVAGVPEVQGVPEIEAHEPEIA